MKIAVAVINNVPVDCGNNLMEQKAALKGLASKFGPGEVRVFQIYNSQRPAFRKKLALPDKSPAELYEIGKKEAKRMAAANAEYMKEQARETAKEKRAIDERRKARRAKAVPSGKQGEDGV